MDALLTLLEKNEDAYRDARTAYSALLSARSTRTLQQQQQKVQQQGSKRPAATSSSSSSSSSSSLPPGAPAPRALQKASDIIIQTQRQEGVLSEASRATYPEMFRDPKLFRHALPKCPWDSQMATVREGTSARPEPFVCHLPGWGMGDATAAGGGSSSSSSSNSSNNTLVLKCEYYALADERSYAAIYVGPVPPGEDAVKEFTTREVMLHLAFRVDPNKSGGGLRQRFLQTYKVKGKWEDGPNQVEQKTWRAGEWPFKREFWLRMTIEPEGCFSYVNGKALGFTPHPGGGVWRPTGDPNLHVVLPVAGDTAEKPSWKVLEAYWGHCGVGEEGRALHTKWRETVGAAPQRRKVGIVDELWVTGLPAATEVGDVKAAFAKFCTVLEVRLDGRGGGSLKLGGLGGEGEEALQKIIAETNRGVMVLGTSVNVSQALKTVQVGGGGEM